METATNKAPSAYDYIRSPGLSAADRDEAARQQREQAMHDRVLAKVLAQFTALGETLAAEMIAVPAMPVADVQPDGEWVPVPGRSEPAGALEPRAAVVDATEITDAGDLAGLGDDIRPGLAVLNTALKAVKKLQANAGGHNRKALADIRRDIETARSVLRAMAERSTRSTNGQSHDGLSMRGESSIEGSEGRTVGHTGKIGGGSIATASGDDSDKAEAEYRRMLELIRTGQGKNFSRSYIDQVVARSGRDPSLSYRDNLYE